MGRENCGHIGYPICPFLLDLKHLNNDILL
jgi:hypothetical protein